MTLTKQRQIEAQLALADKAQQQLEGTLATFTLIMAAIALKNGGTFKIAAEDIDAAGGTQFKIEKNEDEQCIVLRAGEEKKDVDAPLTILDPDDETTELPFDPGKPPTKFENPFIMENENLNPPGMSGGSGIVTTDL